MREWAKWASERTSERSGGRKRSEQSRASKRVSGASERANGRASVPVLQSVFLAVFDHSVPLTPNDQVSLSAGAGLGIMYGYPYNVNNEPHRIQGATFKGNAASGLLTKASFLRVEGALFENNGRAGLEYNPHFTEDEIHDIVHRAGERHRWGTRTDRYAHARTRTDTHGHARTRTDTYGKRKNDGRNAPSCRGRIPLCNESNLFSIFYSAEILTETR